MRRTTSRALASVFISYGGPDEAFAEKITRSLQSKGVNTWFFPDDHVFGQPLHRIMRHAVTEHDRIVLICSKDSLVRPGVLNEIELALKREAQEGGRSILIPIAIDDYVYSGWAPPQPDVAAEIRARGIGDFRGTMNDESAFDDAMSRLIESLHWE